MKIIAVDARRLETVKIPDGVYDGIWGGYRVIFKVDEIEYIANTEAGIRTPRAACKVTSKDGKLSVETV